MRKNNSLLFVLLIFVKTSVFSQIDSTLLKRTVQDTSGLKLNMDAVYNRPFLSVAKFPVAVGGYVEANWQHLGTEVESK